MKKKKNTPKQNVIPQNKDEFFKQDEFFDNSEGLEWECTEVEDPADIDPGFLGQ